MQRLCQEQSLRNSKKLQRQLALQCVILALTLLCFNLHHTTHYDPQQVWNIDIKNVPEQTLSFIICVFLTVLIWYRLFLYTIWVSITRISHFLIPVEYGYLTVFVFLIPLGSIYHTRSFISSKVALVSIWFRMVLTQIITQVYKKILTLTYPPNINVWLVLQFW